MELSTFPSALDLDWNLVGYGQRQGGLFLTWRNWIAWKCFGIFPGFDVFDAGWNFLVLKTKQSFVPSDNLVVLRGTELIAGNIVKIVN